MFDFSSAELLVTMVVILLLVGPKEFPEIIRGLRRTLQKMKALTAEYTQSFLEESSHDSLKEEAEQLNQSIRTIIDMEGKPQQAYPVPRKTHSTYDPRQKEEHHGNSDPHNISTPRESEK